MDEVNGSGSAELDDDSCFDFEIPFRKRPKIMSSSAACQAISSPLMAYCLANTLRQHFEGL